LDAYFDFVASLVCLFVMLNEPEKRRRFDAHTLYSVILYAMRLTDVTFDGASLYIPG
jgi:hypothetical protein